MRGKPLFVALDGSPLIALIEDEPYKRNEMGFRFQAREEVHVPMDRSPDVGPSNGSHSDYSDAQGIELEVYEEEEEGDCTCQ